MASGLATATKLATSLIEQRLAATCGRRMVDDAPVDPLAEVAIAKIVQGRATQPGAHPWQVQN